MSLYSCRGSPPAISSSWGANKVKTSKVKEGKKEKTILPTHRSPLRASECRAEVGCQLRISGEDNERRSPTCESATQIKGMYLYYQITHSSNTIHQEEGYVVSIKGKIVTHVTLIGV